MKRRELKTRIKRLSQERNELNIHSDKTAESDIDYKIRSLEDQLDFQNRLLIHKIVSFVIIIIITSLFVYFIV